MNYMLRTTLVIILSTCLTHAQEIHIVSYTDWTQQYTSELCGPGYMTLAVYPPEFNPSLTYVWKCLEQTCTGQIVTTLPSTIQNGTSMIGVSAARAYFVEAYSGTILVGGSALLQGGLVFSIVDPGGICSITGSNDLCSSTGVRIRLIEYLVWGQYVAWGGTVNWQLNGVDIPGATDTEYTPTQPGTYRCRITLGCGTGYTEEMIVYSSGSYPVAISGNSAVCNGSTTSLSATVPYPSYFWNNSYLWNTGETTSSISAGAGTYQVTVTNINGCTSTASKTVTGHDPVTPQITASGPTTVCQGQSVTMTVSNYGPIIAGPHWRLNGNVVGGGTSFAATTSGNYTSSVRNACGTFTSNTIAVTVNPVAAITPTLTADGPLTRCTTQGLVTLTASPSGPGYTYQWIYNGVTHTPTSSNLFSTGSTSTLGVIVTGNCSSGTSAITQITYMSAPPAKPGSITGPAKVCLYQQGIVYSVAPVVNATGYTWTVPNGASIVSGQGTTSITVNWGNKFGNVSVKSTNPCGNSNPTYKKISKKANCRIQGNGDEDEVAVEEISSLTIFPNPAKSVVHISFYSADNQQYHIELRDISGKLITNHTGAGVEGIKETDFDVSALPGGIYLVFFRTDAVQEVKKLVVE